MTYLKSYLETLYDLMIPVGAIFLILLIFFDFVGAVRFIYSVLIAGLIGPLSLYLRSKYDK